MIDSDLNYIARWNRKDNYAVAVNEHCSSLHEPAQSLAHDRFDIGLDKTGNLCDSKTDTFYVMRISLSVKVITNIHVYPDGISIEVARALHLFPALSHSINW
jgi:hypothetical protein